MTSPLEPLLRKMVELDASDLFLKVGQVPNVRRHGALAELKRPVVTEANMAAYLECVLMEPQRDRFRTDPDLDVAYLSATDERYRINCFRQRGHVGMAIRWVRGGNLSLDALRLPPLLADWAERRHGLVIVAGPTGSGKSTTLSAMVEHMNRGWRRHIITIEDPIEYLYTDNTCLIQQREVGYDTNSFADALRHVVRQAPDVIVIGEMRDLDTVRVALSAAMTGHLVLTTLHTTDTLGTVERLLNYFSSEQQHFVRVELAQTLVGVLCQRLVPMKDDPGRIPATEILAGTALVGKYLQDSDTAALADLLHSGRTTDVESFSRSLARLVDAGLITREAALSHATYPDDLEVRLEGLYSGADSIRQRETPSAGPDASGTPERAADPGPDPAPRKRHTLR